MNFRTSCFFAFCILHSSFLCSSVWAQSFGTLTVQVGAPSVPPMPLVSHGDIWRYRKGTNAPPTGWQTNADDTLDASWLSGPGGFGYADNDDATVLTDMPFDGFAD